MPDRLLFALCVLLAVVAAASFEAAIWVEQGALRDRLVAQGLIAATFSGLAGLTYVDRRGR